MLQTNHDCNPSSAAPTNTLNVVQQQQQVDPSLLPSQKNSSSSSEVNLRMKKNKNSKDEQRKRKIKAFTLCKHSILKNELRIVHEKRTAVTLKNQYRNYCENTLRPLREQYEEQEDSNRIIQKLKCTIRIQNELIAEKVSLLVQKRKEYYDSKQRKEKSKEKCS